MASERPPDGHLETDATAARTISVVTPPGEVDDFTRFETLRPSGSLTFAVGGLPLDHADVIASGAGCLNRVMSETPSRIPACRNFSSPTLTRWIRAHPDVGERFRASQGGRSWTTVGPRTSPL